MALPDTISSRSLDVSIERLHDDVELPLRATTGSAGYDVRAHLAHRRIMYSDGSAHDARDATLEDGQWSVTLAPAEMALIPLGFRTRLPVGVEAQVRPRSGQAFKRALTIPNAPGTVDADYAEEWMVIVRNDSPVPQRIVHGERIAQVVFAHHLVVELREATVERSSERQGGFGSTGR
jgi:dUTP pyrophosphatase